MRFGIVFIISAVLIAIECLLLLSFSMQCPLRSTAVKYAEKVYDGFDIFLPAWLARHNVAIFTVVLLIAAAAYIFNRIF